MQCTFYNVFIYSYEYHIHVYFVIVACISMVYYFSKIYFSQVMVGNTHGLMALVDLRGKGNVIIIIYCIPCYG